MFAPRFSKPESRVQPRRSLSSIVDLLPPPQSDITREEAIKLLEYEFQSSKLVRQAITLLKDKDLLTPLVITYTSITHLLNLGFSESLKSHLQT